MTRSPDPRRLPSLVLAASALLAVALLAGCVAEPGGVQSSASPGTAIEPTELPVDDGSAAPGSDGGSAGSTGSLGSDGSARPADPDQPISAPPAASGDPGSSVPFEPKPSFVAPRSGLTGVHRVAATLLTPTVDGRHVTVQVDWWSGVEPCNALAGVDVKRDGQTVSLTIREGSAAAPNTACIEIAVYKATLVDLGTLEPGTWTIKAFGDAPPVTVTIR